jgi:hypothetical protein
MKNASIFEAFFMGQVVALRPWPSGASRYRREWIGHRRGRSIGEHEGDEFPLLVYTRHINFISYGKYLLLPGVNIRH